MVEDRVASLVRGAALLLSSDRSLEDVLDGARALLAQYVDASLVLVFLERDGTLVREYASFAGESDGAAFPDADESAMRSFTSGAAIVERVPEPAIFVPIIFGGQRIGVLTLRGAGTKAYDERDVTLVETCAIYLGAKIVEEERRAQARRLEHLAQFDHLTNVANRASFEAFLEREWYRAARTGEPISVALVDVDFFKSFNDRYGHVVGDACLQQVARACADCVTRGSDVFARYGGEEFVAVLPGTSPEGAIVVAEQMREAIGRLAIPHEGSSLGRVSATIGVASVVPDASAERIDLIAAADRMLYDGKDRGRNIVVASGYLSDRQPLESNRMLRGNLPQARTRFIGREAELRDLLETLRAHPLLTIAGAGGVGKTRLGLEVARRLESEFRAGTWFIDLSTLGERDELAPVLGAAMRGIAPPSPTTAQIASLLKEREALVILDNCEHVLETVAPFVEELLEGSRCLRVICTSRESLGVVGEFVYRVTPLAEGDALELFSERAREAGVAGVQTGEPVLREIVAQLDGIPLAIELAAPRLTVMSLAELNTRLNDRLETLRASHRRGPSRQQTLRALIDWSYRLLNPAEQRAIADLAIFTGGWTLQSAAAVIDGHDSDILETLQSLVVKSMIVARGGDGASRFDMLETTREYAAEQLQSSGDAQEIAGRHAAYFQSLARNMRAARPNERTTPWMRAVSQDRRNLRAALQWLIERERFDGAAAILEDINDWFYDRGAFQGGEFTAPLRAALECDDLPARSRAAFALALAEITRRHDPHGSNVLAADARSTYLGLGEVMLAASALRVIVFTEFIRDGKVDIAWEAPLVESISAAEVANDLTLAADLLNNLGILNTQTLDDLRLPKALECFERAISMLERRGDADRCGLFNGNASDIAFYMGETGRAIARARRAVALLEHNEETWLAGLQYLNLGHFATWDGDFETARVALRKAMDGMQAQFETFGAASVYDKYARLAHRLGRHDAATRLLAYADASHRRSGGSRQRREARLVEELRADLRERLRDGFDAEYHSGQGFTSANALATAESL